MTSKTKLIKHVSPNELRNLVRKEKDKHVFQRLLFISHLYKGVAVEKASKDLCVSKQTGYDWLKLWNEHGYEGLPPRFSERGRPPKLTEKQKGQLKEKLKSKSNWLTHEVRALIKKDFGITYSPVQVSRILRSFKMHYAKPYPHDYRRPKDAREQLEDAIAKIPKTEKVKCVFGFMDEASPQTTDNKQRFWSFDKPEIVKNTSKYRANTFGFYPINGKKVVEFMERSTSKYVCEFLRLIRERNPVGFIVIFIDNARSHHAKATKDFAKSLGIHLVFIPPYSPDLNPIEKIWKSIRKRISQVTFIKSEWSFKETIRTTFHRLAKRSSFMEGWLKIFQPQMSNLL